jgi:hypothetical protein
MSAVAHDRLRDGFKMGGVSRRTGRYYDAFRGSPESKTEAGGLSECTEVVNQEWQPLQGLESHARLFGE